MQLTTEKRDSFKLFNQIAGSYDFLNRLLSLGIDKYWRRQLHKELPSGETLKLLDLACGTGDVSFCLARNPRIATVLGTDLSEKMLDQAKLKQQRFPLSEKLQFEVADGVSVPFPESSFDVVSLAFGLRNFPDPWTSLKNIQRVLRPGGRLLLLEFSLPQNFLIRAFYLFYFRKLLPTIGNFISGHKHAYTYLNQTVESFPYGAAMQEQIQLAGLHNLKLRSLSFGIASLYVAEKKA